MQLRLENITKAYKDVVAVNMITTTLDPGIYGVLGPNGSGKTTLLRMIVDTLEPSDGYVYLDDKKAKELQEIYRDKIGYLPQTFGYYPEFSAYKFLLYIASCKGLSKEDAKKSSLKWLEEMRLLDVKDKKIKTFSGGMKQRLGIAQALLNDPSIIILDEPTAGLDVQERIRFRQILNSLSKNRIIIISTHIVSDIESIADKILVIKKGNLLYHHSCDQCLEVIKDKVWEFRCREEELDTSAFISRSMKTINGMVHVRCISDQQPHPSAYNVEENLEDFYLYVFQEIIHENATEI